MSAMSLPTMLSIVKVQEASFSIAASNMHSFRASDINSTNNEGEGGQRAVISTLLESRKSQVVSNSLRCDDLGFSARTHFPHCTDCHKLYTKLEQLYTLLLSSYHNSRTREVGMGSERD
jgi:hypothetical protein